MATPSKKSPAIENLLTNILGTSRTETIRENKCVICGCDATEFKDDLSRRGYAISGMCQQCQDRVFGC